MLKAPITPQALVEVLRLLEQTGATGSLRLRVDGTDSILDLWHGAITGFNESAGRGAKSTTREELVNFMRGLLELERGTYAFEPEPHDSPMGPHRLHVGQILDAVGQRPLTRTDVLKLVSKRKGRVEFEEDDWAVAALVDGRRTVGQIIEVAGVGEAATLRSLVTLLRRGVLETTVGKLGSESEFRVVVVCTGNQFRSPLLAAMIGSLATGLSLRVESFGIKEVGRAPALPEAIELGREMGLDLSAHRASSMSEADLSDADLVLVFERAHLARAVVDAGAPYEATFLLLELVELLHEIEPGRPDEDPLPRAIGMLAAAHSSRAPVSAPSSQEEILDPLGGPARGYRLTAERLWDLSEILVGRLFGVGGDEPEASRSRG